MKDSLFVNGLILIVLVVIIILLLIVALGQPEIGM